MSTEKILPSTIKDEQGNRRCYWCGNDDLYIRYHNQEWGNPVADDQRLFEKICLEGFQAGLSWITILRKREAFREAFCDFDFHQVAKFTSAKVDRLVKNAQIIRHRGKIQSTVNNAQRAIETLDSHGSLAAFIWSFEPRKSPTLRSRKQVPATTQESSDMSKALKKNGWTFVGPTTCYAMMQSIGMVNDHIQTCHRWAKVKQLRKNFKRPQS